MRALFIRSFSLPDMPGEDARAAEITHAATQSGGDRYAWRAVENALGEKQTMSAELNDQLVKELNQQLSEVNKCFLILGKAIAAERILMVRVMAQQAANFAVIRSYLIESD